MKYVPNQELYLQMKIPLLHPLEKKIQKRLRTGGFEVKSATYAQKIKPILKPIETENKEHGFLKIKQSNTPLVSILIPVHNQFDYTRKCLNSIARNTSPEVEYEIILIDDLSSDKTLNIGQYYPGVRVIRNIENQGFLRNMNHAATVARGEFIHLLNNDTIVAPCWLTSMLDVFNCFANTGAVGSKLVYPNGVLQEAGGYITSDAHFGNFGKQKSYFDLRLNYTREVDYTSGASLLIRKSVWEKLNGFDESFLPAYFEDTDLAMRIRQLGLTVMYQPKSNVFHFESVSYQNASSSPKAIQMQKNKELFLSRWQTEMSHTHSHRNAGFHFYERNDSHKKTILYIDGEVPHQYSCGARLSLNYIQLLREMGYNVKFLPMNTSPTIEADILTMGQLGVEILAEHDTTGNLVRYNKNHIDRFKDWLVKNHAHIDYYLLARPSSHEYLKTIRSVVPKASFLYHPADLHFLRYERSDSFKISDTTFRRKRQLRRREQKKQKELQLLKQASQVLHVSTFENEYLEENYRLNNGAVIPCLFFDEIKTFRTLPTTMTDLMFIGGRHSASVDGIQWFLEKIFPDIIKECPEAILHIVGDCGKSITPHEHVIIHGRLSEEDVIDLYHKTIVILPLRFGAGVKGKTLEAMYYGAPFVSTSIGLEGIPDIHSAINGRDTTISFANELIQIIKEPFSAKNSVAACQQIINAHFTKQVASKKLNDIFTKPV